MGFLSPLLLGFSALAIPIFLLYMLRLRRTDTAISSTFLWQQLVRDREANAPWQKLRPNLLMLLQLLILAALVLALARPFREVKTITTGRIVLLLDASVSMNTTDGEDGKTRFEEAKELALDTVSTLGSDDTMTVIRVAEVPEVLAAATRDRSILRDAIEEAESSTTRADWVAALTLAAAGARGVDNFRVVVLSDGGLTGTLPEIPGDFRYVKVGKSGDNVAITALSTRTLADQSPQLFAQITNFGDQETEVVFELHLDGELNRSNFETIPAHESHSITIEDLPTNFTKLEARITPSRRSNVPDYLENDNAAYAVNTETTSGNVLVMTEGNIFIEQVFEILPGIELTQGDPANGLPSGDYDLIILDGWLPDDLPDNDLLIIDPPSSNALFDVTGTSTNTAIDQVSGGVLQDDERTRFVDFAAIAIRQFRTVERIEWATVLVETEEGLPLILAGEVDNQQIAIVTFALRDSNLPLNVTWPVLVANLMEWYRPQRAIAIDSLAPGDSLRIRPTVDADEVRIEKPDGERATLKFANESPEVFYAETELLGFYDIEVRYEGEVVQRDTFAVNLFDTSESRIAPIEELHLQTSTGETVISSTTREETGRRELWTYLVSLGLLILGIEWWYYHRSLHRKPKALTTSILTTQRQNIPTRRWRRSS